MSTPRAPQSAVMPSASLAAAKLRLQQAVARTGGGRRMPTALQHVDTYDTVPLDDGTRRQIDSSFEQQSAKRGGRGNPNDYNTKEYWNFEIAAGKAKLDDSDIPEDVKQQLVHDALDKAFGGKSAFENGMDWVGEHTIKPALDTLDLARSGAMSAGNQLGLALRNEFKGEDNAVGFDQWLDNTLAHKSAAEYIAENHQQFAQDHPYVTLGAGLALDVGADPLTYLAPEEAGARSVEQGLRAINEGRKAAEAAGDVEKVARLAEEASKLSKTGRFTALTDEGLEAVGKKGGTFFNKPGTGRIAQRLHLADEVQQVQVISRDSRAGRAMVDLAEKVRPVGAAVGNTIKGSKVGQQLGKAFGGSEAMRELKLAMRSGDAQQAMDAAATLGSKRVAEGVGAAFEIKKAVEANHLLDEVKGIKDGKVLTAALEGVPDAVKQVEAHAPGWIEKAQAWQREFVQHANDVSGQEWMRTLSDFGTPRIPSDEAIASLRAEGKRATAGSKAGQFGATDRELARQYHEGDTFMGEALRSPDEAGKSVPEQMVEISHAKGLSPIALKSDAKRGIVKGEQAPFFETDLRKSWPRYIASTADTIKKRALEASLVEKGVAKEAIEELTKSSQKSVGRFKKLTDAAERLTARQRAAEADARLARGAQREAGAAHSTEVGARRSAGEARIAELDKHVVAQVEHANALQDKAEAARRVALQDISVLDAQVHEAAATAAVLKQAVADSTDAGRQASRRLRDLGSLHDEAVAKEAQAALHAEGRKAAGVTHAKAEAELQRITAELEDAKALVRATSRMPSDVKLDLEAARQRATSALGEHAQIADAARQSYSEWRAATSELEGARAMGSPADQLAALQARATEAAQARQALGPRLRAAEDIANARGEMVMGLRAELESTTQAWSGLAGDLAAHDEASAQLVLQADQVDEAARDYGRYKVANDRVSERGYIPNADGTESFWHGGPQLDLVNGTSEHGDDADNLLFLHVTDDPTYAEHYANRSIENGQDAAVHELFLRGDAANLKTYHADTSVAPEAGGDSLHWALQQMGIPDAGAKYQLAFDMFEHGWERGLITPEYMASHVPTMDLSGLGVRAQEIASPRQRALEAWQQVKAATDDGVPFNQALAEAFTGDEIYDPFIGIRHEGGVMLRPGEPDLAVGYGMAYNELRPSQMDDTQVRAVVDSFKHDLQSRGFDGIAYEHQRWATDEFGELVYDDAGNRVPDGVANSLGVFDPAAYESSSSMAWTYDDALQRQTAVIDRSSGIFKQRERAQQLGSMLTTAENDARSANLVAAENHRQLRAAEQRMNQALATRDEAAASAAADELEWRGKADEALTRASDFANQAQAEAAQMGADIRDTESWYHAQASMLDASRSAADAELARATKAADRATEKLAAFGQPKMETRLRLLLDDGYVKFGPRTSAPDYIVDALSHVSRKLDGPEGVRPLLRQWDRMTNWLKAHQIGTPGAVFRNVFGGWFNNWLAGVEHDAYDYWRQGRRDYAEMVRSGFNPAAETQAGAHYREIMDAGLQRGGLTTYELEMKYVRPTSKLQLANPLSPNFVLPYGYRRGQEVAENYLRGAMAMDSLRNGHDIEAAVERVAKFHFDYEDLSTFERTVARRVIPFYTWTRKNLPLQLEQMLKQPVKYEMLLKGKRAIESQSSPDDETPDYLKSLFSIRLPSMSGGGHVYVTPDLPVKDIQRVTDFGEAFGTVHPLLKLPFERTMGKSSFTGIPFKEGWQPVPTVFKPLTPFLGPFADVQTGADGEPYMRDADIYVLDQLIVPLARVRRLFPDEERYQKRLTTTALSFGFGLGVRTNDEDTQNTLRRKRADAMTQAAKDAKSLGYLPNLSTSAKYADTPVEQAQLQAALERAAAQKVGAP